MDMNVVRLCFQCELERKDGDRIQLAPVVTNPIYDKSKKEFHAGTQTLDRTNALFMSFWNKVKL